MEGIVEGLVLEEGWETTRGLKLVSARTSSPLPYTRASSSFHPPPSPPFSPRASPASPFFLPPMRARANVALHLKHIGLYGNECLAMHRLLNIKKRRASLAAGNRASSAYMYMQKTTRKWYSFPCLSLRSFHYREYIINCRAIYTFASPLAKRGSLFLGNDLPRRDGRYNNDDSLPRAIVQKIVALSALFILRFAAEHLRTMLV